MAALTDLMTTTVAEVPHPVFVLSYEQKNITNDITPYVLNVTYTDYLSGQSDELEVTLEDADGRWIRAWYPGKGDALTLKIGYAGLPLLPCGSFEIDEIEFAEPPATVTIRALATGIRKSVRTRESRPFENTTLAAIAQRIAKRNKLTLVGKIRDIHIDRVTQYQERDVAFLTRLGREYGYAFKIVGTKLVFTELADLRDGKAVATVKRTDLTSIRMRDKIKDVYQQAKGKYHDPKTKKLVVYGVQADGQVGVVGQSTAAAKKRSGHSASSDTLKLSSRGSKAAVQAKTKAALDAANLQQTGGTVTLPGNPKLVAGSTFELADCGKLSGKYLVESARHRLDRGGGYVAELEVKRTALPVKAGGSGSTAKKTTGKTLKVYGMQSNGQVGVVGTSQASKKK
ncbi:contractile injection system protein, VgrG/Pvc8 family [Burkholderia cepacia]|uniref:contractile injection system protein, VgrG/Pvc8 family n=1 Tax=Burkholderia cepacia TaxID=292 RepID=UPI0026DEE58F|nr:contractile injection system protein, VgrG/Pvc8 family [Burkholderia cepacia]MDO5940647.1 contractile injection system protein, VgrG/Pvc8 family [Burkholderia cepacia]